MASRREKVALVVCRRLREPRHAFGGQRRGSRERKMARATSRVWRREVNGAHAVTREALRGDRASHRHASRVRWNMTRGAEDRRVLRKPQSGASRVLRMCETEIRRTRLGRGRRPVDRSLHDAVVTAGADRGRWEYRSQSVCEVHVTARALREHLLVFLVVEAIRRRLTNGGDTKAEQAHQAREDRDARACHGCLCSATGTARGNGRSSMFVPKSHDSDTAKRVCDQSIDAASGRRRSSA